MTYLLCGSSKKKRWNRLWCGYKQVLRECRGLDRARRAEKRLQPSLSPEQKEERFWETISDLKRHLRERERLAF